MRRALRIALLAVVALAGAAAIAIGASAILDRPARTVTSGVTVEGSKEEVWDVLTDLEGYEDWNPVFPHASGGTAQGDELELELVLPGHGSEQLEPTVLVSRPGRKLWWQDRLGIPGLRDWEYEFVLEPVEGNRVLVVQQLRAEGLLAPLADAGAAREALDEIGEALRRRLADQSR